MDTIASREVDNPLHLRFRHHDWWGSIADYLLGRYKSLEQRLTSTFRYVECDPRNLAAFSFEFSGIVRDSGSIFGSAMDKILEKLKIPPQNGKYYTMLDYKDWLVNNQNDIAQISVEMSLQSIKRFVMPFSGLEPEFDKMCWWSAQNDLKHSDFDYDYKGNLQNAINGTAAVAILFMLAYPSHPSGHTRFFSNMGKLDCRQLDAVLFCKS